MVRWVWPFPYDRCFNHLQGGASCRSCPYLVESATSRIAYECECNFISMPFPKGIAESKCNQSCCATTRPDTRVSAQMVKVWLDVRIDIHSDYHVKPFAVASLRLFGNIIIDSCFNHTSARERCEVGAAGPADTISCINSGRRIGFKNYIGAYISSIFIFVNVRPTSGELSNNR